MRQLWVRRSLFSRGRDVSSMCFLKLCFLDKCEFAVFAFRINLKMREVQVIPYSNREAAAGPKFMILLPLSHPALPLRAPPPPPPLSLRETSLNHSIACFFGGNRGSAHSRSDLVFQIFTRCKPVQTHDTRAPNHCK